MNLAGVARGRFNLARNSLFGPRGSGRGGRPVRSGIVLTLGLAALAFAGLRSFFAWIAASGTGPDEAAVLLGLLLTAGLVALFIFDLQEAVSVLLLDSDLELLRRAPLAPRQVFLVKLADALVATSTLILVFLGPSLLAFASVFPLPIWAWVLLPIQLCALWAIPLGIGVAGTLLLVSRLPVRRAREGLALLSTLTLILVWLANAFLVPRLGGSGDQLPEPLARLMAGRSTLASFAPPVWAARTLAAAARDDVAAAIRYALALAAAGAAAIGLAAWTAGRALEAAQLRVSTSTAGRRRARPAARAMPAVRRGAFAAILRRDAALFFRDWTVLTDVLTGALLWTLLPIVSVPVTGPSGPWVARAMLITLAVALGYEVAARALPFERGGAAWQRLAPVPVARWLSAKLAGVAALSLPILLIATASVGLAFRIAPREWLETLSLALPALGLALALGLMNGAAFGDPAWTNPRAMLKLPGRLIASLLLIAQVVLWMGIAFAEPHLRAMLPRGFTLVAPAVLAIGLAMVPLRATARRLERTEYAG